ncbi:pyridoxamine 5'-phosphate oxidase [Nocardioides acrostichi]|uniref:Pyridoxamine 5'-phosphate oxidase n=1 Tax=Nocardioides acrostichi TaxID=2784339 RepID=A0A930YDW8_9ACTN|nr:pyridoxamine 5'-phosphate oxidase [Nocardioides acrostichi]MBF4162879.1 pyridoxamine 5'-phosphate oxidase [Nocardioides acrostichi]
MSIPVDLADLPVQLERFGPAYLLTTSGEQVKAVAVLPRLSDDGTLRVSAPGRGSVANADARPSVTLMWPPQAATEPPGFTLLVDGEATTEGDDVLVSPTWAVLHKPAGNTDGPAVPGGCGH